MRNRQDVRRKRRDKPCLNGKSKKQAHMKKKEEKKTRKLMHLSHRFLLSCRSNKTEINGTVSELLSLKRDRFLAFPFCTETWWNFHFDGLAGEKKSTYMCPGGGSNRVFGLVPNEACSSPTKKRKKNTRRIQLKLSNVCSHWINGRDLTCSSFSA